MTDGVGNRRTATGVGIAGSRIAYIKVDRTRSNAFPGAVGQCHIFIKNGTRFYESKGKGDNDEDKHQGKLNEALPGFVGFSSPLPDPVYPNHLQALSIEQIPVTNSNFWSF